MLPVVVVSGVTTMLCPIVPVTTCDDTTPNTLLMSDDAVVNEVDAPPGLTFSEYDTGCKPFGLRGTTCRITKPFGLLQV